MVYNEIKDPFRRLVRIMERLQEPGGCPWDIAQTHESLKQYMIEECYEALDAIDRNDFADLKEELGDVMLQAVFHSVLAAREGKFTMDDVLNTASAKMVFRHPHVFGEADAHTAEDVLQNWDKLKAQEREAKGEAANQPPPSMLASIPAQLPALLKAQRMQEKVSRVGFDWEKSLHVLDKVQEEIGELREAIAAGSEAHAREEIGDLIFSIVNLARFLDVNAEEATRQTAEKFRERFGYIEQVAREQNRALSEMTIDEMEGLWQAAKKLKKDAPPDDTGNPPKA